MASSKSLLTVMVVWLQWSWNKTALRERSQLDALLSGAIRGDAVGSHCYILCFGEMD